MDHIKEKKKAQVDQILHLLRGYVIPAIGALLFILLLVFVYIPNIFSILGNISALQDTNNNYAQTRNRIVYFKNLSGSNSQIRLTDNLIAINGILPDQAKDADSINMIQSLAQADGLQVLSATGTVLDQASQQVGPTYSSNLKVSNIIFTMNGTAGQAEKLFQDINNEKQLAAITDVSMQGSLSQNTSVVISLTVNMYSMDSNAIEKSISLLNNVNTSYTTDYINGL